MKRSEMILVISDYLSVQYMTGRHIKADEILKKIEAAGMLPPTIENRKLQEIFENVWESEEY